MKVPRGKKLLEPKVPYEVFGLVQIKKLMNNQREYKAVFNAALERWGKEALARISENAYIAAVTNDPLYIRTGYEPEPFLKQHGLERTYERGVNRLEKHGMGSINPVSNQVMFQIAMDKDNPDFAQITQAIKLLLPLMRQEDFSSEIFGQFNRNWTYPNGWPIASGKRFSVWDGNFEHNNQLVYSDKTWYLIGFESYYEGPKILKQTKDINVMLRHVQKEHYVRTWPDKYSGSDW